MILRQVPVPLPQMLSSSEFKIKLFKMKYLKMQFESQVATPVKKLLGFLGFSVSLKWPYDILNIRSDTPLGTSSVSKA